MEKGKGLKSEDGLKPDSPAPYPTGYVGCTQLVDIKPSSRPPKPGEGALTKCRDAQSSRWREGGNSKYCRTLEPGTAELQRL